MIIQQIRHVIGPAVVAQLVRARPLILKYIRRLWVRVPRPPLVGIYTEPKLCQVHDVALIMSECPHKEKLPEILYIHVYVQQ